MPIEFRCPTCDRLLKTGDDRAGATAKCPQCGSAVLVPAAVGTATIETAGDFGDETATPQATTESNVDHEVVCPMCGQPNEASAPRCLACGEELLWAGQETGSAAAESRRFGAVWREAWAKWTANLGIGAAAAAIAGAMFFGTYMLFIIFGMVMGFGLAAAGPGGGETAIVLMLAMIGSAYLLMFLVYAYLLVGLANFSLRLSRQRDVGLGAMFPGVAIGFSSLVSTFFVMLALTVAMAPGMGLYVYGLILSEDSEAVGILLAITGYLAMFVGWGLGWALFWPVHYTLADGTSGAFSSLVRGVRIAVANPKLSFLLALVHTGLTFAGYVTCYVGLLFAVPLSFTLFAVAYNRCARAMPSESSLLSD
ncbi:MAG: zinc ribbon domain-containing protein [Planctomycetaceae bacterium]